MSKPPACTMRRPRAAPVRVSSALTRRLPWYALAAVISVSLWDSSKGLGVVKRSRTLLSQFFAKLDLIPPRAYDIGGGRYGDKISFLALIVVCAVVIYCVKRNNPASADDADAAMVPADAIANPTLFKRLLNA